PRERGRGWGEDPGAPLGPPRSAPTFTSQSRGRPKAPPTLVARFLRPGWIGVYRGTERAVRPSVAATARSTAAIGTTRIQILAGRYIRREAGWRWDPAEIARLIFHPVATGPSKILAWADGNTFIVRAGLTIGTALIATLRRWTIAHPGAVHFGRPAAGPGAVDF